MRPPEYAEREEIFIPQLQVPVGPEVVVLHISSLEHRIGHLLAPALRNGLLDDRARKIVATEEWDEPLERHLLSRIARDAVGVTTLDRTAELDVRIVETMFHLRRGRAGLPALEDVEN